MGPAAGAGAGELIAGAGATAGGGVAGCGAGVAGAGRVIWPPGAAPDVRVSAGCTAGGTAGAGSNTGGSSSTVYSLSTRPRGVIASSNNVTNGSAIDSRDVT